MDEETGRRPSNPPEVTRGARALAVAVAAALAMAACSGDDGGASAITVPTDGTTSTTRRPTTTTTTDPDAAIRAEVEQAYYDQWDAYAEILSRPDPTHPLIDRWFTGSARERLLDAISTDIREGLVTRRPSDPSLFRATVNSVEVRSEGEAMVTGCLVDGLVVVQEATDEVVNDSVASLVIVSTFVSDDGTWKLADSERIERFEGGDGCEQ